MHVSANKAGMEAYRAQAYTDLARESVASTAQTRTRESGFSLGPFKVRLTTEEPLVDEANAADMAARRLDRARAGHFVMDLETEELLGALGAARASDHTVSGPLTTRRRGARVYAQAADDAANITAEPDNTKSLIAVI